MPKEICKQKIQESWFNRLEFKEWLGRDAGDCNKAYCKYCITSLNTKIDQLSAHEEIC